MFAVIDWTILVGFMEMALAALAAYMAWKAGKGVQETHLSLNSRLDQMIALVKESAHAEGRLEGAKDTQNLATKMLSDAEMAAEKMLADARQEATKLVGEAAKTAEELRNKSSPYRPPDDKGLNQYGVG